jgi:hypothetical protein
LYTLRCHDVSDSASWCASRNGPGACARAWLTLRSGVFARWTGVVALIGAISFLITFAALLTGTGEDSVFGFGFLPGVLAL